MENTAAAAITHAVSRRQLKEASSKFRGIRLRRPGKFGAEITVPGMKMRRWLGTFATEEEAALAYDRAARSYGIAEWRCNFPNGKKSPTPPLSPPPPLPESSGQGGESGEPEKSEMLLPCQINLNYPAPLV